MGSAHGCPPERAQCGSVLQDVRNSQMLRRGESGPDSPPAVTLRVDEYPVVVLGLLESERVRLGAVDPSLSNPRYRMESDATLVKVEPQSSAGGSRRLPPAAPFFRKLFKQDVDFEERRSTY